MGLNKVAFTEFIDASEYTYRTFHLLLGSHSNDKHFNLLLASAMVHYLHFPPTCILIDGFFYFS